MENILFTFFSFFAYMPFLHFKQEEEIEINYMSAKNQANHNSLASPLAHLLKNKGECQRKRMKN